MTSPFASLRARLAAAGVGRPDAEAWAMLERASGVGRLAWLTEPGRTLGDEQRARLDAWVAGRAAGEPLQHLLGVAPFWGLTLAAGPDAMVPRPETERLVELALATIRDAAAPRVLDLGTGSGAIAIAIARERPDAEVWAADVDDAALALARRNVRELSPGVRLVRSDLLTAPELRGLLPRLALLIANLPYLPDDDAATLPAEVRRDPPRALFGGPDGLAPFRRAWAQAAPALAADAESWWELDPRNVDAAAAFVRADRSEADRSSNHRTGDERPAEARPVEVHADLAGRRRFLRVGARGAH